jgi:hypothetical protein
MTRRHLPALLSAIGACLAQVPAAEPSFELRLPTANQHLLTGEPEKFYMYVDRTFEGETTKPWEGGAYGFVRTPVRTKEGIFCARFHEGIDITPVQRDRAGNPLDLVSAIGAGTVVHASTVGSHSNYGKYVVVEHRFPGGPFFSLYAHLAEVTCQPGDPVRAGSVLGRMGFTGIGLNRTRAHLHLEFCLLMNSRYQDWHAACSGGVNRHGIYNGMNLAGTDIARLLLLHHKDPTLSIPAFIRSTPVHFSVTVPRTGVPEIALRYPWLLRGDLNQASPSWEISFSATGLPLMIAPATREVERPVVSRLRHSEVSHGLLTRGLLTGIGATANVTRQGEQLLALVTGDFPGADRRTSQVR